MELAGVADEHESPLLRHGESNELVEGAGAAHAGLVDDDRRAGRQLVAVVGLPCAPLVEQLGDGVGGHAGLVAQHLGGLGGGRHAEEGPPLAAKVLDGAAEGRRLARAGRADHENEPIVACDRRGGVGLQDVEAVPVEAGRRVGRSVVGVDDEGEDALLLGQHALMGEVGFAGGEPDRAAVRRSHRRVLVRRVEGDAGGDDAVGHLLHRVAQSRPENCDTGGARSQTAWSTSARVQVEPVG